MFIYDIYLFGVGVFHLLTKVMSGLTKHLETHIISHFQEVLAEVGVLSKQLPQVVFLGKIEVAFVSKHALQDRWVVERFCPYPSVM